MDTLGHIYVQARLRGLKAARKVKMLVDKGSTYLMISPKLARKLGAIRLPERIPTSFAVGAKEELEATALILELEGRQGGAIAVIRECEGPLLGVEGLEALGLKVDPSTRKLEPTRAYAARV